MRARPISLLGYQRLLESDAVLWDAAQRLRRSQVLDADETLRLGRDIETRILLSWQTGETVLAPLIVVTGRADDPEDAAAVANTLAEAFVERTAKLTLATTRRTTDLIAEHYTRRRAIFKRLSRDHRESVDRFQQILDDTEIHWDRKIARVAESWDHRLLDLQAETSDLIVANRMETGRLIGLLVSSFHLSATESSAVSDVPSRGRNRSDVPSRSGTRERQLSEVAVLRTRLAQNPPTLLLERAVSNETLWQSVVLARNGLIEKPAVSGRRLVTEVPNPVVVDLMLRLADVEPGMELSDAAHGPRALKFRLDLEYLQRRRSAVLSQLLAERTLMQYQTNTRRTRELRELRRQKTQEVDSLRRRWRTRIERIERDLEHARRSFEEIGAAFNQAELARSGDELRDIRIGAPAVAPIHPLPGGYALRIFASSMAGLWLGWLASVTRRRSAFRGRSSEGPELS